MKKFAEEIREHLKGAIVMTAALACASPAGASDLTVLHSFDGTPDAGRPMTSLLVGQDGRLYGGALGGADASGVIYSVKTDGSEFRVLLNMTYSAVGITPMGVVQAQDGTLFVVAQYGANWGAGVLFSMQPDGTGVRVRHGFETTMDGLSPNGPLIQGTDGRIYGTARYGGIQAGGTLFAHQPGDDEFHSLHHFNWNGIGSQPESGAIQGSDGRLYGTVAFGGQQGGGAVYAIETTGAGFSLLHGFDGSDGAIPSAGLMQGADGRLYGTTGTAGPELPVVLFALEPDGTGFEVLHQFEAMREGAGVQGALVQGQDGRLYGTASIGGPEGSGTIFAIEPDGSNFEVLHFMRKATEGNWPGTGLVFGGDGRLYGANGGGGPGGHGTLFAIAIESNRPPEIANPATASGGLNVPLSYHIAATHAPNAFTATGLPAWLTLDSTTGLISGTPAQMGEFVFTIGAANSSGSDSTDVVLTIGKTPGQVTISNTLQLFDGMPKAVTVTTVPAGLSTTVTYDGLTTPPTNVGYYSVTATIDDPSYQGSQTEVFEIAEPSAGPPRILSQTPFLVNVSLGSMLTLEVTAFGGPPLSFKWRKYGDVIEGATSAIYSVPNATPAVDGRYSVEVSSPFGLTWSNDMLVKVFEPVDFVAQPMVQTAVLGGSVTYSATATGTGPFTYQWQRNGVAISGATAATLTLTNVQAGQGGNYSVVVSNAVGSVTSNSAALTIDTTPRLINVSCRGFAGAGDDTLVMGFYIAGSTDKTLLIRGIGPKLLDHNVASVVADPRITVYRDKTPLDSNDDWDAALAPEFARMGAFALDAGSKDAALVVTLAAGRSYTVHLVNNGPVAEGLIEVYDLSRDLGTRLTNVSCRLNMKPGQLVIVGTSLIGSDVSVLARNIGPGLAEHLHEGASVLADPHLRIYSGDTEIAVNDDWEAATGAWFVPAGAFGLDAGSKDAAIRVPFTPGGITVHATGKGSNGGIALIELYESP